MSKSKLFDIRRFPMDMARFVCAPLLLVYRMKCMTPEGEPYKEKLRGGAVIAANHTSMQDPFLVGTVFWYRRLHFLAAEAVFGGKLRSWLLRGVGAIRIDRNAADIEAINKSVETVKEGRLLAVFPQGRIKNEEKLQSVKSGAVLIAMRAGVPIIPVNVLPKRKWYSRRRAVIGQPIVPADYIAGKFPKKSDIDCIAARLMEEMNRLGEVCEYV